jgi:tetratricopeptide (TPR) repeat protein
MLHQDKNTRQMANGIFCTGWRYFERKKWLEAISFFEKATDCLLQITNKDEYDYRKLREIYYHLGNSCFNCNHYEKAITIYHTAINYLQMIRQHADNDRRMQVELYINCCDAYLHLNQLTLANQSLLTAIDTHQQIQYKKPDESALIHIYNNPLAFYDYYEKRTSQAFYLNSPQHLKQAKMLEIFYHESRLNNVLNNIENIHIQKNEMHHYPTSNAPLNQPTTQLNQHFFSQGNNCESQENMEIINDTETISSITSQTNTMMGIFYHAPSQAPKEDGSPGIAGKLVNY